jgi:hypothetical protein
MDESFNMLLGRSWNFAAQAFAKLADILMSAPQLVNIGGEGFIKVGWPRKYLVKKNDEILQ